MENGKCVLCGDPANEKSDKRLCMTCEECLDPSILVERAEQERQHDEEAKRPVAESGCPTR